MNKKLLILACSLLLATSCNNPTEQPTSTEIEESQTPDVQESLTQESLTNTTTDEYCDENGILRKVFDDSNYSEHKFIDVESIYLIKNETYLLSVMPFENEDLSNVNYFSEIPNNITVDENGKLTAISLSGLSSEQYDISGTIYVFDDTRLQKIEVHVVDYYEYGSFFTSVDKGRLYGKNIVFFGDSITHNWAKYPSGNKPVTDAEINQSQTTSLGYPDHYIPLLNAQCKFASVTNCAWSGGTMAYLPRSSERFTYKSFPGCINENEAAVSNADIIFVFYGTNDLTDQVPIGKLSDKMSLEDKENSSFIAGMQFGINYIRQLNDDANIVFFNLLTRTYTYYGDIKLQDYNEAIEEVATANAIKVLDVNSLFEDKEFYMYSNDGLHLNTLGYKVLTEYILTRKNLKNEINQGTN